MPTTHHTNFFLQLDLATLNPKGKALQNPAYGCCFFIPITFAQNSFGSVAGIKKPTLLEWVL
jgi:hypothetical protein